MGLVARRLHPLAGKVVVNRAGTAADRMPPALALHRRQLQHRGHLAGGMHADVGEQEQIELIIENLLQHRLRIVAFQRKMAIAAKGSKALTAGVLAFADVVTDDLVAGIPGDGFQPTQRPDRAVVIDQVW